MNRNDAPTLLPNLEHLKWTPEGLLPAIVQDVDTGAVLMMAWMDKPALLRTLETGQTHFYSRSRKTAWHKGATSGHIQEVASIRVDCDADVLLIHARQIGGACHEGYRSCFFRQLSPDGRLEAVDSPMFKPESVYGPSLEAPANQPSTPRPGSTLPVTGPVE